MHQSIWCRLVLSKESFVNRAVKGLGLARVDRKDRSKCHQWLGSK